MGNNTGQSLLIRRYESKSRLLWLLILVGVFPPFPFPPFPFLPFSILLLSILIFFFLLLSFLSCFFLHFFYGVTELLLLSLNLFFPRATLFSLFQLFQFFKGVILRPLRSGFLERTFFDLIRKVHKPT